MPKSKSALPASGSTSAAAPVTTKPAATPAANHSLPPALKLADVEALSQSERIALFEAKDKAAGRIFIDLGKLFVGIEGSLAKGEQIFPLLMKSGVRKGSVSNASQTARVFKELVTTRTITEAAFDAFRWGDICALNRVMSGASKRKLTAAEAVKVIAANPKRFDEDLESIFLTGHDMAGADKIAKAEAVKAAAEEAEARKAEAAATAAKAAGAALAAKAAEDKTKADADAKKAAEARKKADDAAKKASTAAEKKAAEAAQKKAEAEATAAAAAQAKAKEDAKAAKVKPPANVTKMPPQGPSLTSVGEQLDKLMESIGKLPVAQQVAFYSTTWKAADALLHDMLKGHLKAA
jgi:chemotaxis protein histidine kinase CheA